ncbi:PREDICTED: B-cell CLL/lymphoma 9 protein isoform X2 [Nanorana parkeri]|uniref:B-cell CLL/lymphoma 9 protein isoform X2 n=1 Tax=Nanorana parkeri TaxID=125878 RepID=UPI0008545374|nr:PREDICTED: B-cell CLL/lymphoma 9 protein isoform X2 [Nanorana parkeri]
MLELQEGRAHFNKRERNKKEKDEQKDNTDKSTSQKTIRSHLKNPSPPKNLASPTASVTVSSGSLSMHSSNPKVRNSPSGNTQSSPKSKPEVMVHPPTVMSPSGNPQLDPKFSSQGKQASSTSQSQASPCDPKSGNHTPKPLQGPGGSMGLKNGSGNGAKGKGKRERSISAESFDQRDPGTPTTDSEIKDCNTTDPVMPLESHAPHNMTPSNTSVPRSSTPSHGSTMLDAAPGRKTPSKVVYVFSTEMANKAAEAVMKGQAESIVLFHIQSTSNSKAERTSTPTNTPISTNVRNEPKANPRAPTPQEQNHSQPAKVQSNPPGPALPSKPAAPHCSIGQDGAVAESKIAASSPANSNVLQTEGCGQSSTPNNQAASPVSQGNVAPPVETKPETKSSSQQVPSGEPPPMGENPDGLSQEQLEHRERSLQTLRDIQRMLFPDEKEFALKELAGQNLGPQPNSGMLDNPQKKLEGPIQAMMAQSQNLGKGPGPHPDGGMPFGPQGHRDMPFSPEDMVPPPMNPQPGQDHLDHMTPEQVAWLKLQQEFYEEKRRKQEQAVVQQRSLQDMMVHQHGPRGMVRGPPPPYQMNPGEGWVPGGPEPYPDGMGMPHPMPPKGMPPHPNVPGSQMQRLPGFVGIMNPDMDGPNVPNPGSRPGLPGVNWPDEVPKIPDGRGFPPGQSIFSGPGRGERFPNPQGLQDEIFHQHVSEKQLGMPPGIAMEGIRPGMEMNRGMPPQRSMEPGSGMFPRMPGDAALSPSRIEFHKGMPPNMGPNREVEFGMGPGNMNMKVDMNLNVNMNSNQQLISQKMRDVMAAEEMIKMRPGSNEMLPNQQKMHSAPFEHSQQEYIMSSRPYLNMSQVPGGVLRNPREQMGPDQRTNSRLSHMPPLPLNPNNNPGNLNVAPPGQRSLGRKPLDNVSVSGSQVNSPGVNPLKSPTMRQVQSPMLGSPSGNLKSPQTPSQLAGMLTGPTAAAAASIKSPPVMGSAAASPVHLKSPSLPVPSPGWTSSPKPPMQSPGIPPNQHKPPLGITSPAMMGNMESGMVMNSQNPSKMPGPHSGVSMPTLSPMGMTQPLSHGGQMPSPNAMPPNLPHGGHMGGGMIPHNAMMGHGHQDSPMVPQGRMAFAQGFPPVQSPPQVPFPHNGPNGGHGNFPPGMGFPGEGPLSRPGNLPPNADPAHCKSGCPGGPDSFGVMGNNMSSVFTDPDLQEVIRPGASGIPEFDLSRIIPSEKPSQTLQYFPRGEVPGRKPQQGPGFSHLPGMMGEPNPRMGLPMGGMGGHGPVDMPGHNSMRPPGFMQQTLIGPHHRMMSPAQSGMPGQLTMMGNPGGVGMMSGKERMPGVLYSHPGPVGSPNMLMSMQGMMGPQQNLMIPPQMRPRGMPTDVGMGGFSQGPGNPGNMMF